MAAERGLNAKAKKRKAKPPPKAVKKGNSKAAEAQELKERLKREHTELKHRVTDMGPADRKIQTYENALKIKQEKMQSIVKERMELQKQEDPLYEEIAELKEKLERAKQGCVTLNLRLRDPETCALRVLQYLLGSKLVEPLSINQK